jgi:hypothetical protein
MGHVRSNSEITSQQPRFTAKRSEDFPDWAIVTCPYEDCNDQFLVRITHWFTPRKYKRMSGQEFTIKGRSCPYCFRAARLPSRRGIR